MARPTKKPPSVNLLGLTLSNDDYHKDTSRISKSGLDLIHKSPAHYYSRYLDPVPAKPNEDKEWAFTGNLVGCAITEYDELPKRYAVLNDVDICAEIGGAKPRTTNKYKEWFALESVKLAGKTLVDQIQMDEAIRMREAVYKHPAAKLLLSKGQPERSFYFIDPVTGVACRIRPDWLNDFEGWVVDIKTSVDASPEGFGRSAFKYRYHVQDPYYTDGLIHNGFNPRGFIFIVVEKTPPHNVAVYVLPNEAKELGRGEYKTDLHRYANCLDRKEWPGYSNRVEILQLPSYAFYKPNNKFL